MDSGLAAVVTIARDGEMRPVDDLLIEEMNQLLEGLMNEEEKGAEKEEAFGIETK